MTLTSGARLDEEIFTHTMETFPEFSENSHAKLAKLDEDWMKSEEGKNRWRTFIESCAHHIRSFLCISINDGYPFDRYKEKIKDYNFGSLIRMDSRMEYGESNTIFGERFVLSASGGINGRVVTRMQVGMTISKLCPF